MKDFVGCTSGAVEATGAGAGDASGADGVGISSDMVVVGLVSVRWNQVPYGKTAGLLIY